MNDIIEKPIIFTGDLIKAILEGRKTQTRRVIKPQPNIKHGDIYFTNDPDGKCPFGKPGQQMWVREVFTIETNFNTGNYKPPHDDGRPLRLFNDTDGDEVWEQCHYKATDPEPDLVTYDKDGNEEPGCKWSPPIFLPRWASRIQLMIKDVRVERVQDITPEDAKAEGVDCCCGIDGCDGKIDEFADLWDSINKKHGFGWDVNPWVWVIEFERLNDGHN